MSLNWKIELSLDNRPRNPMPFLVISLLLHGAVLFGLENYLHQLANQTLQSKAEELIPIKFIELPPEQVAVTPPVTTKQRASTNSRGGGEAPPKAPSATRALDASSTSLLPSQKPSLTQSKSSTPPSPPQPSKLPQQPPPALPVTPLSPTAGNQNTSPPVTTAPPAPISASSNQVLRPNPRPVEARPANSQPQSSPSAAPPVPKLSASSSQVLRPNPRPVEARPANSQPQSSPSAAPPAPKLSASSSQVLRPNPRPVEARPNQPQSSPSVAPPAPISASPSQVLRPNPRPVEARPANSQPQSRPSAAQPAPISASPSQTSRQNASLLGGPVSLNNPESAGEDGGNLANAGRIGTDSQGVDALKDANIGPYLDGLRQEVVQQWHPERPESSKQTIVSFAINRTGEVNNLRILQSSGSTSLDQAALQAVQQSSPFKPLPSSYSKTLLNIHFKFNINVRGQLELTK